MLILNLGPLDFVRGRNETIFGEPLFIHNRHELYLLMVIQSFVHRRDEFGQLLLSSILRLFRFLFGIIVQQNNSMGGRVTTSSNAII